MVFLRMFKQGFNGGIHPNYSKITSRQKIIDAKLPAKVVLPLSQHIGKVCKPIVSIGEYVKTGQKIADSDEFMSVPIHSSISGTVKSIENYQHPVTGKMTLSVIIESDGKDVKQKNKKRDWSSISSQDLKKIIKDSGIVGLGGAGFPTHVKLEVRKDKLVDTVLINGAECEPYITADHRLMLEKPDELIIGIKIIQKILGVNNVFIGIEDNKVDAIKILQKRIYDQKENSIKVIKLPSKYPQGAEKTLIYSILKRKVPTGGLPIDVGVEVQNVGTTIAIYEAVCESKPLYEKVLTVTGKVNSPKNLRIRVGTMITELIEQVDGYNGIPKKLINGGPLMGFTLPTDELPIIKSTNSIVVLNHNDIQERKPIECIRCGKCLEVCPLNLNPALIVKYAEMNKIELSKQMHAMDCYECGCCSYICPSKIQLVHLIRYAKSKIKNQKLKNK
ncbi:MAG: electron transport complex subunit RsxC [Candidatus Woesearchaeota archaeon]